MNPSFLAGVSSPTMSACPRSTLANSRPIRWRRLLIPRGNAGLAWVSVASIGLFVALAWPVIDGKTYAGDDLDHFHLPLRHFYWQCLQHGDAFDWLPNIFCGFYLTGEGQIGTYHPWHWLLYRWLPFEPAFNLEVFAQLSVPVRRHDRLLAADGPIVAGGTVRRDVLHVLGLLPAAFHAHQRHRHCGPHSLAVVGDRRGSA